MKIRKIIPRLCPECGGSGFDKNTGSSCKLCKGSGRSDIIEEIEFDDIKRPNPWNPNPNPWKRNDIIWHGGKGEELYPQWNNYMLPQGRVSWQ